MARREVDWAELEACEGWAGIFTHVQVGRVLWSRSQVEAGYRIDAVGFLPAVLVLPLAWRLRLPPLDEAWTMPTTEGG